MSLCLCTIVRNEERFLEGMLRSVQGVVDRVVVVDTGSTDRSVEIARKAGATVLFQPWQQDFSAPRNLAVAQLSGGWVLVLDADERLAPGIGTTLRSVLTRQDIDVGLLPLHNARTLEATPAQILSGEARQGAPTLLARLFRWAPELRWEGVIHESPRRYLQERRAARIEAPILHYGYVEQLRHEKTAADRNLPLLEESCRRQPSDPLGFMYLGRELTMLGRQAEAAAALERGWALLPARLALPSPPPLVGLPTQRAQLLLERGEVEAALGTLHDARRMLGDHSNFLWLEARCRLWQALQSAEPAPADRLEQAAALLREVQARGELVLNDPLVEGVGGSRSAEDLAVVCLLQGDAAAAIAVAPSTPAGELCRLEARIQLGEAEAVLATLRVEGADHLLLAALGAEQLGAATDAEELCRQALRKKEWLSVHRQLLARQLLARLLFYRGQPTPGPGDHGRLASLIGEGTLPPGPPLSPDSVRNIVATLVEKEQFDLLERLLRRLKILPTLYAAGLHTLDSLGLAWEEDHEEA